MIKYFEYKDSILNIFDNEIKVRSYINTNINSPTVILLHEGLGSVSMWRDIPNKILNKIKCNLVLANFH